jgi:hypothetical protein
MLLYGWLFHLDSILGEFTMDNLCKCHIIVSNSCCMCKKSGETLDHLLHCDIVGELWNLVF